MDIFVNILVFLHLAALVFGMGSGFALSRLGPYYGQVGEDAKLKLFVLGRRYSKTANMALAVLWVTGLLTVWLKYGGVAGLSGWFWAKMILVVILSASIGMGSAAYRKFVGGDVGASSRAAMAGRINLVAGLGVILCAVFAFA